MKINVRSRCPRRPIRPSNLLSTNQLHVCAGAYESLEAFNHSRPSRLKWRISLCGLLCMVLPFVVFAWGTAYKLSLYKADNSSVPAKVCTRGSDASKSSVRQAVDGRKVIGNGVAPSPVADFSFVLPGRSGVALPEAYRTIFPVRNWPTVAARPPPPVIRLS
jgi:hypothetical protein